MTIDYFLDKDDFLNYQLYTASQSANIKKKRSRGRIVLPVIYLLFALSGFATQRTGMMTGALIVALLWYCCYPLWDRKRYIRHYEQFIKEHRREREGKMAILTFSDDYIYAKEGDLESKIPVTEIEHFTEIHTNIFIKLKGGNSLILSKNKISDIDVLIGFLKGYAGKLNLNYIDAQDWKWR